MTKYREHTPSLNARGQYGTAETKRTNSIFQSSRSDRYLLQIRAEILSNGTTLSKFSAK